jgi:hypothetical protein
VIEGLPEPEKRKRPDDPEPLAGELLTQPDPPQFSLASVGEKWERSSPVHEVGLRTFVRESMPNTVERADFGLRVEVREYEIHPFLIRDLKDLTPQAILRDLHRPVIEFYVTPELREGTEVIGQINVEFDKLRAARNRDPRPTIEPTVTAVAEEQRRRRDLMAERWEPLLADDAPRRNVTIYPSEETQEEFYRPDFSKYGK